MARDLAAADDAGASCDDCGQEVLASDGCNDRPKPLRGGIYRRVRFGEETRQQTTAARCGDCGAKRDWPHHPGCAVEECPRCEGQASTCGCKDPAFT